MSTTVNGNACRPWSMGSNYAAAQDPANFPDGSIDAASNYCRNPDSDPGGPWCHVAHSNIGHWEYCPVPLCSGKCINLGVYISSLLREKTRKYHNYWLKLAGVTIKRRGARLCPTVYDC